MPQILVVVHQATSEPGLVGQILQHWGYSLDIRCPAIGHPLPATPESYNGVIVFGGPMSANEDDLYPFIRQELDWLPTVLESQMPYLGICLGAQLMARVLGAQVRPHREGIKEIGYFPLAPTPWGHGLFPQPMHVYHWHGEGFTLPSKSRCLATGSLFPHQAFEYGQRVFGLQFHPEITADLIATWTERGAEQLTLPGAQARDLHFYQHRLYGQTVERWLRRFLRHWLSFSQHQELPTALSA